jgi:predicted DNA-binding transcriptional regulator AlpA
MNNQHKLDTSTLTEAQQLLGVSRTTLWRIIRQYKIPVFHDVLDSRVKRIRTADVEQVLEEAQRVRRGIAA